MTSSLNDMSSPIWTFVMLLRVPLIVVSGFVLLVLDLIIEDTTYEAIRFAVMDHPYQLGMIGALLFVACFTLRFWSDAMIALVASPPSELLGWAAALVPRLIALAPAAALGGHFIAVGFDPLSVGRMEHSIDAFDLFDEQVLMIGAGVYYLIIGAAVAALPAPINGSDRLAGEPILARLFALSPAQLGLIFVTTLGAIAAFLLFSDTTNVVAAQFVGSVGVVVLWAFAATVFFAPIALAAHVLRAPLLLILVIAAGALSYFDLNDNHAVRTVEMTAISGEDSYYEKSLSLASWLKAREDLDLYDYDHYPVFVVATEGGALRSAYFTARGARDATGDLSPLRGAHARDQWRLRREHRRGEFCRA